MPLATPEAFNPSAFILPREGSAVYYSPKGSLDWTLLLVAPSREMAVKLAFDLSKFYDVPLRGEK